MGISSYLFIEYSYFIHVDSRSILSQTQVTLVVVRIAAALGFAGLADAVTPAGSVDVPVLQLSDCSVS